MKSVSDPADNTPRLPPAAQEDRSELCQDIRLPPDLSFLPGEQLSVIPSDPQSARATVNRAVPTANDCPMSTLPDIATTQPGLHCHFFGEAYHGMRSVQPSQCISRLRGNRRVGHLYCEPIVGCPGQRGTRFATNYYGPTMVLCAYSDVLAAFSWMLKGFDCSL
jgi:hypothetical protein